MDKKNRKTLKAYFKKGSLPSEQQFASLIDSMLNTIDDGLAKNSEDGLKIASIGNSDKLVGFYKNIEMKSAIWSMEFDGSDNRLLFNHGDSTILSLDPPLEGRDWGRVGVNTKKPETELDVRGTLASTGRMGNYPGKHSEGKVLADGKPHTIIENLDGCTAFEIMAGVGGEKIGKICPAPCPCPEHLQRKVQGGCPPGPLRLKVQPAQALVGGRAARLPPENTDPVQLW